MSLAILNSYEKTKGLRIQQKQFLIKNRYFTICLIKMPFILLK